MVAWEVVYLPYFADSRGWGEASSPERTMAHYSQHLPLANLAPRGRLARGFARHHPTPRPQDQFTQFLAPFTRSRVDRSPTRCLATYRALWNGLPAVIQTPLRGNGVVGYPPEWRANTPVLWRSQNTSRAKKPKPLTSSRLQCL